MPNSSLPGWVPGLPGDRPNGTAATVPDAMRFG